MKQVGLFPAALLGVLQFSIGAVLAPLVGIGGTSTAVPMAEAITAFSIIALVTFTFWSRPTMIGESEQI